MASDLRGDKAGEVRCVLLCQCSRVFFLWCLEPQVVVFLLSVLGPREVGRSLCKHPVSWRPIVLRRSFTGSKFKHREFSGNICSLSSRCVFVTFFGDMRQGKQVSDIRMLVDLQRCPPNPQPLPISSNNKDIAGSSVSDMLRRTDTQCLQCAMLLPWRLWRF